MKFIFPNFAAAALLALVLQLGMIRSFSAAPDLVFAVLITAGFFLPIHEFFLLLIPTLWILNWTPIVSSDLLLYGFLPTAAFFARHLLPSEAWLTDLALASAGIAIFYISSSSIAVFHMPFFFADVIFTGISSALLFFILHEVVGYHVRARIS